MLPAVSGIMWRVAQSRSGLKPSFHRRPTRKAVLLGAQSLHELLEPPAEAAAGGMHVVALGNHPQTVVPGKSLATQHPLKGRPVRAVSYQQLMLVELDLEGSLRMQHGDAGAAVVEEQVFEVS